MTIWVAAVDGSPTGEGTSRSPREYASLFDAGSPIQPGDRVRMRSGTYTPLTAGTIVGGGTALNGTPVAGKGVYTHVVGGSAGNPVIVEPWPGETVRINGAVHVTTGGVGYISFQGIEIGPTPTSRYFAVEADIDYPALYITKPGVSFINDYLHDFSGHHPMGTGGYEISGCVIGWVGSYADTGDWLNYNMYGHNHPGGQIWLHQNAWLYPASNWNVAAWSATVNNIYDYLVEDNIFVNGQVIVGSAAGKMRNNIFRRNFGYASQRVAGGLSNGSGFRTQAADNTDPDGENVTIENNYHYDRDGGGGFYYFWTRKSTVRYNTVLVRSTPGTVAQRRLPTGAVIANNIDHNLYGAWMDNGTLKTVQFYDFATAQSYDLAGWQTLTGWDAHSNIQAALPSVNVKGVIPNYYEAGRGFVYIYNYELSDVVQVNIKSLGIPDGASCRYSNCANMAEYVDFTYNVYYPYLDIPMTAMSWTKRDRTGYDWPVADHTTCFPDFGVFEVKILGLAQPKDVGPRPRVRKKFYY